MAIAPDGAHPTTRCTRCRNFDEAGAAVAVRKQRQGYPGSQEQDHRPTGHFVSGCFWKDGFRNHHMAHHQGYMIRNGD